MTTPHIIAIAGPSLSGKSEFAKRLQGLGATELISITTRPKREHEIDGINYHFVTKEQFKTLVDNNEIIQQSFLHNEFYGMSKQEVINKSKLNTPLIWVIAPQSIPQIENFINKENPSWNLTKCLIFNSQEVLVERLLTRYENDINADKKHYATRFINLIGTEIPEWMSLESQSKFNYLVNNFSQETENNVITGLLKRETLNKTHPEFCMNGLDICLSKRKIKP